MEGDTALAQDRRPAASDLICTRDAHIVMSVISDFWISCLGGRSRATSGECVVQLCLTAFPRSNVIVAIRMHVYMTFPT